MSELLADKTSFHPALEAIFAFTYPNLRDVTLPRAIPRPPLAFHDRHIDPSLSLKSVKFLDFSVVDYLSLLCADEIMAFVQKAGSIQIPRDLIPDPPARSSTCIHQKLNGNPFSSSKPPTRPPDFYDLFRTEAALSLVGEAGMEQIQPPLDDDMVAELKYLGGKHPKIAVYEMFAFSEPAMKLIREMGPQIPFKWKISSTQGYSIGPSLREYPIDAATGLWSKIVSTASAKKLPRSKGRERKSPLAFSEPAAVRRPGKGATVRTAHLIGTRQRPYRPEEAAHLQHFVVSKAWSRAVQNDATFIFFHCGKYERIGFRHRKTQTLYLSELIDPFVQEYYGKMQIGLQLAIAKDLLERREIEKRPSSKKRPAESDTNPSKKRQKASEDIPEIDSNPSTALVEETLGSRHLALFSLDYDVFRSPTPSSFIRVTSFVDPFTFRPVPKKLKAKASYAASDYFSLSIWQYLASGAIGTVHRASATFKSVSRTYQYSDLAVKLAFTEANQDDLRYEYAMYRHLAQIGFTEHILRVYGLLQDAETGVLAIVMDYGGPCLASREVEESEVIPCTEEEKIAFSDALKKLHLAGVIHGDIRSNNLLVDSSTSKVYFIDFDCAGVHPTPENFEYEKNVLAVLLGCYDTDESVGDYSDVGSFTP
ncbi:hypothetical protein M413DRAFT_29653 [Hebeloma cylindrosporum]|uniref:Protein kinase domain-containing protein n=1 Tax=Hebeloma cylindrosporum TaxID=76867 RepID=A0A0C3BR17_HEBCY|nr:hypothetical protein M413DRAFT_29653 [Hebeloma cylindrosporum h7]